MEITEKQLKQFEELINLVDEVICPSTYKSQTMLKLALKVRKAKEAIKEVREKQELKDIHACR